MRFLGEHSAEYRTTVKPAWTGITNGRADRRRKSMVLLGQAAYNFLALVGEYNYQGKDPTALQPLSLKQMAAKKREKGKLTTE